jgi:hypothetical protein
MEPIEVSREDLDQVKRLQIKPRSDWPAVFSTNVHGEIWPFATYGYTYVPDREDVRGFSHVVDEVAERYRQLRCEGGRFFIDATGAFYKDESSGWFTRQFVNFRHCI